MTDRQLFKKILSGNITKQVKDQILERLRHEQFTVTEIVTDKHRSAFDNDEDPELYVWVKYTGWAGGWVGPSEISSINTRKTIKGRIRGSSMGENGNAIKLVFEEPCKNLKIVGTTFEWKEGFKKIRKNTPLTKGLESIFP